MKFIRFIIIFLLILISSVACKNKKSIENTKTPIVTSEPLNIDIPPVVEPTSTIFTNQETPISGDYLEAILIIRGALAKELGISENDVEIINIEPMSWSDSCLGLAEPSEMCLQVITPGYRITLGVDQNVYIFHTNESGSNWRKSTGKLLSPKD